MGFAICVIAGLQLVVAGACQNFGWESFACEAFADFGLRTMANGIPAILLGVLVLGLGIALRLGIPPSEGGKTWGFANISPRAQVMGTILVTIGLLIQMAQGAYQETWWNNAPARHRSGFVLEVIWLLLVIPYWFHKYVVRRWH